MRQVIRHYEKVEREFGLEDYYLSLEKPAVVPRACEEHKENEDQGKSSADPIFLTLMCSTPFSWPCAWKPHLDSTHDAEPPGLRPDLSPVWTSHSRHSCQYAELPPEILM